MKSNLAAYLQKNPKKFLIFDFDHTLFTLHLPWGEYLDAVHDILRDYNHDFYMDHQAKEESNFQLINRFTRKFGEEIRDKTLKYACEFESQNLSGVDEHSEYTDFIRQNHSKYKFFLWTSNCTQTVEPILKDRKLYFYFSKLIGRDSVMFAKPDPEGFSIISDYYVGSQEKSDYLMIGDSLSDENAAEAAGIDFFAVDNPSED